MHRKWKVVGNVSPNLLSQWWHWNSQRTFTFLSGFLTCFSDWNFAWWTLERAQDFVQRRYKYKRPLPILLSCVFTHNLKEPRFLMTHNEIQSVNCLHINVHWNDIKMEVYNVFKCHHCDNNFGLFCQKKSLIHLTPCNIFWFAHFTC